MKQTCLLFFAMHFLSIMVLVGCKRTSDETRISQELLDFPYSKFETAADVQRTVDEATSRPNAILLVHVSWAPMARQRSRFAAFKRDYEIKHPTSDLEFHYIDCTPVTSGYEPLRKLDGWQTLEDKNNGSSLVHGYGELVWCKNGRVMHVERPLDFDSTFAMIDKTESLGMAGIVKETNGARQAADNACFEF